MGIRYLWLPSTGGDVGLPSNWSPYTDGTTPGSTPPGSADEAEFPAVSNGTITGTITVGEWVIDNGAGLHTFAGDTTATFFEVNSSASLTGTWAQIGTSYIDITSGTFTIGLGAALTSAVTSAEVGHLVAGLVVDSALISNGGAINVAADIDIGYSSAGSLTETSGATLSAADIAIAGNPGTSGTLDLSGGSTASIAGFVEIGGASGQGAAIDVNASTLTAQGQVQVGLQSSGTLTVEDGGLLSTSATLSGAFLAIGGAGEPGVVDIRDAGTELNAGANEVLVGAGGSGTLTVDGGATLVAGSLLIAGDGGTGTMDVAGAFTTVNIGSGGLGIGSGGNTGQLTLQQGATLTVDAGMSVGGPGAGKLDVASDATLTIAGALNVGVSGSGTVGIDTGASVISDGAGLSSSNGTVNVLLNAAAWLSSGQIDVGGGNSGTAGLQLRNGATLQATAALVSTIPFLFVDNTTAGNATVDVGGTGTVLDAGSDAVDIGEAGSGALTVHDGATLDAGHTGTEVAFVLGDQSGAAGTVTLTGTTTHVNVTGDAVIGAAGSGTLSVDGTFTVSGDMDIALDATAIGTVGINGTGADLAITGALVVGGGATAGGAGTVAISEGGTLTAATLAMYAGGTLSVDATSSAEIGAGSATVAGQLVIDAGITSGGNGQISAAVTNHGDLVAQSGTLTITGQAAGDGFYDIAAGAAFDLVQPGAVKLRFDDRTGEAILAKASGSASLVDFSGQDMVDIAGIGTDATTTYSGDTATISGSDGSWTFDFGTAPVPGLQVTGEGDDALVVACFVEGTLIATPSGQIQVQRLAAGDAVLTLGGTARRIVWIGTGRVLATRGRRNAATPVIVYKGALAANIPHHDLRITKGHSLYLDGVLVPVEFLVNHRSIVWDDWAQEVSVYHIELETHDVLLANGAPAESYRDDGNRWLFQNANTGWRLPPPEPCAPVLTGGPIVDGIWRRLLDRAGPRPGVPQTDDPDLHVRLSGTRLDPVSRHDGVYIFHLPADGSVPRLVSRAGIPAELGLARDPRLLGVAVRCLGVRQGTRFRLIMATDPLLAGGFHRFEPETGQRWTDGDAEVPLPLFRGFSGQVAFVVTLACTARYPLFDEPSRTAAA